MHFCDVFISVVLFNFVINTIRDFDNAKMSATPIGFLAKLFDDGYEYWVVSLVSVVPLIQLD